MFCRQVEDKSQTKVVSSISPIRGIPFKNQDSSIIFGGGSICLPNI